MVLTIVVAFIAFGILIIIHEAGHFFVAKSVGIRVNEFAIGMGPVIFKKQKGETEYSLRALPLGGFVKMEGEDEESHDERSFNNKSIFAKILVLAAGSVMNFIFAIVIIVLMYNIQGFLVNINEIGEVIQGQPADIAGLKDGDIIKSVEDIKTNTWEDVVTAIINSTGEDIEMTIERDGEIFNLVSNVKEDEMGRRIIGIKAVVEFSFSKAITEGVKTSFMLIGQMLNFFVVLFKGQASTNDVVGPVGIIHLMGEATKMGFQYIAQFVAMISLNLAIINLLPFPALDGGRLLLVIVQGITGKKFDPEKEGFIHFVGFVILIGLMIFVTYKDLLRFIFKA